MIRMVNLSCPKCGMSLDISVEGLCSHCPNCGGPLMITVRQVMDILNDKKEIKQKGVKYATRLSDVNVVATEKEEPAGFDIRVFVITFLITLLVIFLTWKMSF